MTMRKCNINADNVVNEYHAGKSVKAIAEQFGVSRSVIVRLLHEAGIQQRNRSDAMFLRMSQTTVAERKRLASAANIAKRGRPNSPEMLHKRALAHKRFIGKFEQEFIDAISEAGIPVVPQEPFLGYNFDIGCGNVAVEIHTQIASPLSTKFAKKLMQCVKFGKNMIYVWIPPKGKHSIVSNDCYKNVVALVKSVRSDPTVRGQYWVIRSTGELYATGSFNRD